MKAALIRALLADFQAGRAPGGGSDIVDRRPPTSVGPFLYAPWTTHNALPFQDFLERAAQREADTIAFYDRAPTYFPASSPLGRLQRRFGARPGRPDYRP